MKHLYIIGNGFDLFTGLHTSYSDFKHWLEHKYIFVGLLVKTGAGKAQKR